MVGTRKGWDTRRANDRRAAEEDPVRATAAAWAERALGDPEQHLLAVEAAADFLRSAMRLWMAIGDEHGVDPRLLAPLLVDAFGPVRARLDELGELAEIASAERDAA